MTGRPDPVAERRAELARRLASLTPEQRARLAGAAPATDAPKRTIPARDAAEPAPMSFAQELLWRLERASPGHAYNVPRAVRLTGPLDVPALQQALDALVVRHEALRTTFDLVHDEPRQIVNPPAPVAIERIDVSELPAGDREDAARRHMRELAREPFALERDPQLRAAIIRLGEHDHVVQVLSHHVASDGWSGNIVLRELGALYEGFRTGAPPALPPLPVQYADFAAWQRRTLAGDRLERLLDYWREQLAGAPALLDLPTDRPRSATPSFEGGMRTATLPMEVVEGLRALTRTQGATSFMVLLAALYVLLARYTREEEIVVGTPVAGRPYPELEGIVGFFTNTLLLRVSLAGDPTFRELLDRVRAVTLGAYDHQEIPLETLLSTRGPNDRPLATMPQVVLSTEDPDRENLRITGTASTRVAAARGGTKFDLQLWAAERPDGLRLAAEFRTDLFDDATVDRMLRHYGVLLAAAVAAPDTRVYDLPILDVAERHRTLVEWNDTQAGYPEQATIHGLIEAQVRQRPDDVAIEYVGDGERASLTYAELDRRANRVAHTLLGAGVRPDDRVAVCLERSLDIVVAILGVLKAGGAYLPIDPHYPDERIEFTVDDAGATLVLTAAAERARLAALLPNARLIEVGDAVRDGASDEAPNVVVSPANMAYVIYTSGSTGRPKGCMIEHRNVTRLLVNDRSLFDFDEHDVWTVFHSFAFDFSVWELYGALVFGGRAIVVPRVVAQSPADFVALLAETRTTVLNQVPSAFYGLMEEAVVRRPDLAVRYVIFGGEALKPALLRPWRTAWPSCRLINMFGITETTVHVTYKEIGDAEIAAGVSNIGRPIPTLTTYVLDDRLQPVPVGVTGEICVGGLGVARGYLNRPELTEERFVADPFGGARLYRSGDLGRLLPNGEMEYLGRRDHQVKLRGHRIELGEIEAALTQHLGVAEATVMVREDVPGDQRLVAYVVATGTPVPAVAELRDWVRQTLPEVMVPAAFVFLDRFPLTSNGKVDRKALPAPVGGVAGARAYQSPRTTIEHEVAQIFERLLSPGRPIGAFDDFFESGGHSLLAIQMIAEIERVRGQRVPLAWLFVSSTVEALAARLGEAMMAEEEPPLVALQTEGRGPPVAFVHGDWTGGGWYARRLAAVAAPESPFWVLPTIGSDDDAEPWTIETMAARHVAELRKVQPNGPYRVVGFCVGGVVAYEMARQLRAAGETVERLIVIDSSPINARLRRVAPALRFVPGASAEQRLTRQAEVMRRLRWAAGRVTYFNRLPKGAKSRWIVDKVASRLPRLAGRPAPNGPNAPDPAPNGAGAAAAVADDVDRDALVLRTQARAASAYIPGRFDGPIDFIWAEGAPGKAPRSNPVGGWRLLADDVRLHRLPSGHIGLITNNLAMLADALRAALAGDDAGKGA